MASLPEIPTGHWSGVPVYSVCLGEYNYPIVYSTTTMTDICCIKLSTTGDEMTVSPAFEEFQLAVALQREPLCA